MKASFVPDSKPDSRFHVLRNFYRHLDSTQNINTVKPLWSGHCWHPKLKRIHLKAMPRLTEVDPFSQKRYQKTKFILFRPYLSVEYSLCSVIQFIETCITDLLENNLGIEQNESLLSFIMFPCRYKIVIYHLSTSGRFILNEKVNQYIPFFPDLMLFIISRTGYC